MWNSFDGSKVIKSAVDKGTVVLPLDWRGGHEGNSPFESAGAQWNARGQSIKLGRFNATRITKFGDVSMLLENGAEIKGDKGFVLIESVSVEYAEEKKQTSIAAHGTDAHGNWLADDESAF